MELGPWQHGQQHSAAPPLTVPRLRPLHVSAEVNVMSLLTIIQSAADFFWFDLIRLPLPDLSVPLSGPGSRLSGVKVPFKCVVSSC